MANVAYLTAAYLKLQIARSCCCCCCGAIAPLLDRRWYWYLWRPRHSAMDCAPAGWTFRGSKVVSARHFPATAEAMHLIIIQLCVALAAFNICAECCSSGSGCRFQNKWPTHRQSGCRRKRMFGCCTLCATAKANDSPCACVCVWLSSVNCLLGVKFMHFGWLTTTDNYNNVAWICWTAGQHTRQHLKV